MFERIKYAHLSPVMVGTLILSTLTMVVLVKLVISRLFGVDPFPYLLHFFVIAIGAWFGGFRGGIFATVMSSITIFLVFLMPRSGLEPLGSRDTIGLFFFNLEAVSLSYIVSKLRLSKRKLFQAFDDLQQQQARFQLLMDNANGYAVFFLRQDGSVSDWNDGAQRFFGYSAGEVKGAPLTLFFKELPFRRQWLRKLLKNPGQSWTENETRVTCKDGSQFWAQVTVTPLRQSTGFRGFGVVCRDLTSLKELAVQREQFLNDMSHELKTPLTSLKLWVDLMSRQHATSQIEKLNQHTQKLTELINTLLDLNQIQAGRFKLQLAEKPLTVVIDKFLQVHQANFMVKPARQIPTVEVWLDSTRLRMALNIFSQALHDYLRLVGFTTVQASVNLTVLSAHHLQLAYASPNFTPDVLEPFLQRWRAMLTRQRSPLSVEKPDSKAFFAAHVFDLHGHLPVFQTKPGKGKARVLLLNLRLFTHEL